MSVFNQIKKEQEESHHVAISLKKAHTVVPHTCCVAVVALCSACVSRRWRRLVFSWYSASCLSYCTNTHISNIYMVSITIDILFLRLLVDVDFAFIIWSYINLINVNVGIPSQFFYIYKGKHLQTLCSNQ